MPGGVRYYRVPLKTNYIESIHRVGGNVGYIRVHTHTHTYIYIYIYIHIRVYVVVQLADGVISVVGGPAR